MAHNEEKNILRARMKTLCASMGVPAQAQYRTACAQKARQFLCAQQYYIGADVVLSYAALASEAGTAPINERAAADGKALGLPRIRRGQGVMDFVLLDSAKPLKTQLVHNALGIAEPREGGAFSAHEAPRKNHGQKNLLVIVPALAFTPDGRRLGRGKGYYDRALALLKRECAECGRLLTLAGYCFDFQIIDDIPVEAHDIRVDYVFC